MSRLFKNWRFLASYIFTGFFLSVGSSNIQATYYFTDTLDFVESGYWSYNQETPSVDFDTDGKVHAVWSDTRPNGLYPPYMIHRLYDRDTGFNTANVVPFESQCGSNDCLLSQPEICFQRQSSASGFSMFTSGSSYNVQGGVWSTPDTWTTIDSVNGDSLKPNISIVSDLGDLFLAMSNYSATAHNIQLHQYVPGTGWSASYTYQDPFGGSELYNAFLEMDSNGYLYLAYYAYNSPQDGLYICRSSDPSSISGWEPPRLVITSATPLYPRSDVTGTGSRVLAAIAFKAGSSVLCVVEEGGDWTSGNDFSGTIQMVNQCTSCNVSDPDIAVNEEGEVIVVWSDDEQGSDAAYANVSFNKGESFLGMEKISPDGSVALNPRIGSFDPLNNFAVVCEATVDGHDTILGLLDLAEFVDNCDDPTFSNWTAAHGVEVDPSFSHDQGGSSLKFSDDGDLLVRSYSENNKGSVEFWFYDDYSRDADFTFEIIGDDGTKGGVKVMLGIRNEVEDTKYCKNIEEAKVWEPIPGEVGNRSVGWHHVVALVDPEKDIEIYLDPETYSTPVIPRGDVAFKSFNLISFDGGSSSSSGAYFLDDVRVVSSPLPTLNLPSTSLWGVLLLLGSYVLLIKKKQLFNTSKRSIFR